MSFLHRLKMELSFSKDKGSFVAYAPFKILGLSHTFLSAHPDFVDEVSFPSGNTLPENDAAVTSGLMHIVSVLGRKAGLIV